MLYVRGNNGDTDDVEYYVNHLVLAVLRELDGDILYCFIVQSRNTTAASWRGVSLMGRDRRRHCLRKFIK